ncbi:MAG TPA: hypothetical protein VG942_06245 [Hyphomonadaceae bacterium]|nr:hypothetical protein [Hyphomonadaceae bacterium]
MDRVPTVFVESPPPPPPAPPPPPPRESQGGLFISRGFLGFLVVLFLGAAIAGTGYFYMEADKAQKTVATQTTTIADQKKALGDKDGLIAAKDKDLAAKDAILKAHELQYGQIEGLLAQAAKLQKDTEEVLPRRPGMTQRQITPPAWRDAAIQQLTKYVADLQNEFNRIDRAPSGPAPTPTGPKQPNIQGTPGATGCSPGKPGC